jgi:hypothetical protein
MACSETDLAIAAFVSKITYTKRIIYFKDVSPFIVVGTIASAEYL